MWESGPCTIRQLDFLDDGFHETDLLGKGSRSAVLELACDKVAVGADEVGVEVVAGLEDKVENGTEENVIAPHCPAAARTGAPGEACNPLRLQRALAARSRSSGTRRAASSGSAPGLVSAARISVGDGSAAVLGNDGTRCGGDDDGGGSSEADIGGGGGGAKMGNDVLRIEQATTRHKQLPVAVHVVLPTLAHVPSPPARPEGGPHCRTSVRAPGAGPAAAVQQLHEELADPAPLELSVGASSKEGEEGRMDGKGKGKGRTNERGVLRSAEAHRAVHSGSRAPCHGAQRRSTISCSARSSALLLHLDEVVAQVEESELCLRSSMSTAIARTTADVLESRFGSVMRGAEVVEDVFDSADVPASGGVRSRALARLFWQDVKEHVDVRQSEVLNAGAGSLRWQYHIDGR
ncbi:hypothetical protein FB451DRAFT_1166098 [Mycena latifolia]|nr:hypothetical protein FB451DRAFT_1166098 [Mycena latifolia]